ncbi:MAG TPA: glycosyltransferase family 39 protein [Bryobacteraceae bacterium]|nr:glycosyltransferase family 39 protein [Bryobacteraceae bacterium]
MLYLSGLGSAGFLGPDEPRYASIGREMTQSGDWVTPRLNGSPWFEKPPLLYWTTAAANRLGLRDEWAARLPVALISLAFLSFFYWMLRREFSASVGLSAAAILAGSAGWLAASFAAIPDLPMSAALAGAMLIALFDSRRPMSWLGGALLGAAVLAKGFVPAALFTPVWFVARGKRTVLIAGAFFVAAPWYLLCFWRNGSAFWNDFFWRQHVSRLLSAEALQHGQPFWYYIPILLAGLFPWTPLAALLARGKIYQDPRLRFLALWMAAALAFFSLVPNKLPFYVLPLLPVLAIVLGAALEGTRALEWPLAASVLTMTLLPSIAHWLPEAFLAGATRAHWAFYGRGLIAAIFSGVVWGLARRGQRRRAIFASAMLAALGGGYLKLTAPPLLDQRDSVREFWTMHGAKAGETCMDSASVSRAAQYGLNYYAGREVPDCSAAPAAELRIRGGSEGLLLERR